VDFRVQPLPSGKRNQEGLSLRRSSPPVSWLSKSWCKVSLTHAGDRETKCHSLLPSHRFGWVLNCQIGWVLPKN
jgi:hypothetical protein